MPKKSSEIYRHKGLSLTQEISSLDQKILELMSRRSRLLAKAAIKRREKNLPLTEGEQEKRLWATWEAACRDTGLDPKLLRQMFTLANGLGYRLTEKKKATADNFRLTPRSGKADISVPAPASRLHAAFTLTLAAATGAECEVGPALVSDELVELCKALNAVGGHLSWDADVIRSAAGEGLAIEDKLAYVGNTPLNFYLVLALAIAEPGRCRISGGPELKLFDITPVAEVMPALGARVGHIDHRQTGLPVRVESSARMADEIRIGDDCPAGLAASLTLAAWSYPKGLSLVFTEGSGSAWGIDVAATVLKQAGIEVSRSEGRISVAPGSPKVAGRPALPVDAGVSAQLLALARTRGGKVELEGEWPTDMPEAEEYFALLAASGLELSKAGKAVTATPADWPEKVRLEPGREELVPLAVGLACAAPEGAEVVLPDTAQVTALEELFMRSGKPFTREENLLKIEKGSAAPQKSTPWMAPDAWHAFGAALVATSRPGFLLANPGTVSDVWPTFWTVFNRLPEITDSLSAKKETDDEPEKTKRRIRVR